MIKKAGIVSKKAIPIWLIVVVLAACGMGAAAGTVLSGKITGDVPVAVSQALLNEAPIWIDDVLDADENQPQQVNLHAAMGWINEPNRSFSSSADDNTAFEAAAELAVGDWTAFYLPLKNASNIELAGELTLNVPECLEVEVYAPSFAENIYDVTRIGMNTWLFKVRDGAEYDPTTDVLAVVISIDDDCAPGYYDISGTIKQIAIR